MTRRPPASPLDASDRCGHAVMEERPQHLLANLMPFLERHRERWPERLRGAWKRLVYH